MTTKYNNVFIEDTYTICGNYENDGPLSKYFDKKYKKDLYFGEKSWEKAETHILKEASKSILEKNKLKDKDIDLLIDRKSTRLNSSHNRESRMPSSA